MKDIDCFSVDKARKWAYIYFAAENNREKSSLNRNRKDIIFEIDCIMAHVLGWDRARLYAHFDEPLALPQVHEFKKMVEKRKEGIPLAYLTGVKEFMGLEFAVDENVLIPRPETEHLVEEGIKAIDELKQEGFSKLHVMEPFTGSGAVSLALTAHIKENQSLKIYAGDISPAALNIARKNREKLQVSEEKVTFLEGDTFSPFPRGKNFNLILANPPYIPSKEQGELSEEVRTEPLIALDGGEDGLDYYRKIKRDYKDYLHPEGVMLLEIGSDQCCPVRELFSEPGIRTQLIKDLAGRPRLIRIY